MSAFTPSYIPTHLQGKVSDFRHEADGNVSFSHPSAAQGTFGPAASRQSITPDVFRSTFDEGYRGNNLERAVTDQYGVPGASNNFANKARNFIVDGLRGSWDWGTATPGRSIGTVGALAALLGGGIGAARGLASGDGMLRNGLLYALGGGALGAGATALAQHFNNRREEALSKQAFAESDLISRITQDFSISYADKQRYMNAIGRLTENEKRDLSELIRAVAGGALGAVIGRYLSGKGLLGMAVGGMLGAVAGRLSAPAPYFNALGQMSTLNLQR